MTESCQTCRFNTITGKCRRFPPVTEGAETTWPVVRDEDWCGEWKKDETGRSGKWKIGA